MTHDLSKYSFEPGNRVEIAGLGVEIWQDDSFGWDMLRDEPVDVFGRNRWGINWNIHLAGANVPDFETCFLIESEEWEDIVANSSYDYEERTTGVVVWPDYHDHAITFKSWRNAARGMLKRNGFDLDDIRVEQIAPEYHQTSDSFFVVWSQKQMDHFAGVKGAKVSVKEYQSVLSGDIWGFSIDDPETGEVDSCGGFIGKYYEDGFHMFDAMQDVFDVMLSAKRECDALAMQNARPDMYEVA